MQYHVVCTEWKKQQADEEISKLKFVAVIHQHQRQIKQ